MAYEIGITAPDANGMSVTFRRVSDRLLYNFVEQEYGPFDSGTFAQCKYELTYLGGDFWAADFPEEIGAGYWRLQFYKQIGDEPEATDPVAVTSDLAWDGGDVTPTPDGVGAVVITPLLSEIVGPVVVSRDFEVFANTAGIADITVLDRLQEPVTLTGKTLRFVCFRKSAPTVTLFQVDPPDVTIMGPDENVARVNYTPEQVSDTGRYVWQLWSLMEDQVIAEGALIIKPSNRGEDVA